MQGGVAGAEIARKILSGQLKPLPPTHDRLSTRTLRVSRFPGRGVGAGVPLSRIMRMRWVLTWKDAAEHDPDQTRKAKARLVVLGYTDPDLVSVP